MKEDEYKKQLWEFFASQGGVPKEFGMFAAQGWYIRKEDEFRKLKGLETLPRPSPQKPPKINGEQL